MSDQIKKPKIAGGVPAIIATLKTVSTEMGLVRGVRTLLNINQTGGIDCPGCAWPEPDRERSHFEFCENGAKHVAEEATTKRVTPEFFKQWSVADLLQQSDQWLGAQGRLTHPMLLHRGASHYEPVSWDDAFELIAAELNSVNYPDQAIFYTSGRTSNEAAFLYQLFARQFGTNNLPDCSNMCHESSGAALTQSIGVGKGCVTLRDFEVTDCIIIMGQNPGTNHPRMMTYLERAKKNGAKIIAINPMPEPGLMEVVNPNPQDYRNPLTFAARMLFNKGIPLSDLWLPVRLNGDMAVMRSMMKEMLDEEDRKPGSVFDHEFIEQYTAGFEAFVRHLRATPWDLITEASGLSREQIRHAANIAMDSRSIITCWAMGLTQHKNAVATIQEIANFHLLGGHIGRPGAGPCPVRGHSNVQGDRTMGIWERMTDRFREKLAAEFQFTPPPDHGADTVETIRQMHDGRTQFFLCMRGNA